MREYTRGPVAECLRESVQNSLSWFKSRLGLHLPSLRIGFSGIFPTPASNAGRWGPDAPNCRLIEGLKAFHRSGNWSKDTSRAGATQR